VDICHHRRKWKSPILGVERIVLRDVFFASIILAYVEPKLFFHFRAGKFSSAAPEWSIHWRLEIATIIGKGSTTVVYPI
jgi:hypothetical protein